MFSYPYKFRLRQRAECQNILLSNILCEVLVPYTKIFVNNILFWHSPLYLSYSAMSINKPSHKKNTQQNTVEKRQTDPLSSGKILKTKGTRYIVFTQSPRRPNEFQFLFSEQFAHCRLCYHVAQQQACSMCTLYSQHRAYNVLLLQYVKTLWAENITTNCPCRTKNLIS